MWLPYAIYINSKLPIISMLVQFWSNGFLVECNLTNPINEFNMKPIFAITAPYARYYWINMHVSFGKTNKPVKATALCHVTSCSVVHRWPARWLRIRIEKRISQNRRSHGVRSLWCLVGRWALQENIANNIHALLTREKNAKREKG